MDEWNDEIFWRAILQASGDDFERILPVLRRCQKILEPPYPEVEVIAAHEARKIREANRLLAECLAKRGKDTAPPDGKGE